MSIFVSERVKGETQEQDAWITKSHRLFNIQQLNDPEAVREIAGRENAKRLQQSYEYGKKTWGQNWEPKTKQEPGPEVKCSSSEPVKYLSEYLAAISMGSKFVVSKEQAGEFSAKLRLTVDAPQENGYPNPFKLSMICNEASKECKTVIKQLKQEQSQQLQKDRQKDKSQGLGH